MTTANPSSPYLDSLFQATAYQSGIWVGTSAQFNFDGQTITVTYNDVTKRFDIAASSSVTTGYISGSLATGTTTRIVPLWYNDTGASKVVSGPVFVPIDDVAQDASNSWNVQLVLASDPTVALAQFDTKTGSAPTHRALSGGTAEAWGVDVTVPDGDSLMLRLQKVGSPTTLGGMAQGRRSAT